MTFVNFIDKNYPVVTRKKTTKPKKPRDDDPWSSDEESMSIDLEAEEGENEEEGQTQMETEPDHQTTLGGSNADTTAVPPVSRTGPPVQNAAKDLQTDIRHGSVIWRHLYDHSPSDLKKALFEVSKGAKDKEVVRGRILRSFIQKNRKEPLLEPFYDMVCLRVLDLELNPEKLGALPKLSQLNEAIGSFRIFFPRVPYDDGLIGEGSE
jgi:hypothetical protein